MIEQTNLSQYWNYLLLVIDDANFARAEIFSRWMSRDSEAASCREICDVPEKNDHFILCSLFSYAGCPAAGLNSKISNRFLL